VLEAVAREIDDLFGLVREANNQQPIILGFRTLGAAIRKRLAAAEPAAPRARTAGILKLCRERIFVNKHAMRPPTRAHIHICIF
jgi:hypothetical protein